MRSKPSDKCPQKREERRQTQRRRMKTETEIGVRHQQAKGHLEPLAAGRGKKGLLPGASGGGTALLTP